MSPAFTLYGSVISSATNRVRLMLADANFTDYKLVIIDLQNGGQKSPAHLALNPFGRVPVLRMPNGFLLYESRAICAFLAATFSLPYIPLPSSSNSPAVLAEAYALFNQASQSELSSLSPFVDVISLEKFAKAIRGIPADEARVVEARARIMTHLDVIQGVLATGQKWIAPAPSEGSEVVASDFSLVDVCYVGALQRLTAAGEGEALLTGRPSLEEWWNRCMARQRTKQFVDGLMSVAQIREMAAAVKS